MKYSAVLAGLLLANAAAKNDQVEDAQKYVQIVEGFLKGTVDAEGFTDIETCIGDGEVIIEDVESAVGHFEKKSISDMIAGVKDIANAIKKIQVSM